MKRFKFPLAALLFAGLFTMAFLSCKKEKNDPSLTSDAAKKTKMDVPTITCGISTTASIEIKVTAGATGAPAGFSVQWLTAAAYALGADGVAGTADDNYGLHRMLLVFVKHLSPEMLMAHFITWRQEEYLRFVSVISCTTIQVLPLPALIN